METETKSKTNLELKADRDFENALKDLKAAVIKRKLAREVAAILPLEITDMGWWAFRKDGDKKYYLETDVLGEEKANECIRQLKLAGVYNIKSKFKSFANKWYYTGLFVVNDCEFTIMVDGGSKPPACHIEESKEIREVTVYKAICEETGEEVK